MAKKTRGKRTAQKQTSHHAELDKILSVVTEYAKMFGFPVPPIDKMEKMVRSISHDIEQMFAHNKSKKPIQSADILVLMLKMGLITLVALPLIKKIISMENSGKEKKGKMIIEKESMVD